MEGYMFFMNTETATDTLNEGICFGIGEARYSDEKGNKNEKNTIKYSKAGNDECKTEFCKRG